MIFKVKIPPSDLHKNANLAELRCNKKKNCCTGIQFTLSILKCIFISSIMLYMHVAKSWKKKNHACSACNM